MESISFEDFLLEPSRVIDPFHRLSGRVKPFVVLVEFCQVIGPKPIIVVSSENNDYVESVDVNDMALWLMSTETASGSVIVLHNHQMGIYAISYYFTFYDIKARAFQRPVCMALISSDRPSKKILETFTKHVKEAIYPQVVCNRSLFLRHVSDVVAVSDSIEEENLEQYYSLHADSNTPSDFFRFNQVVEQTRLLKNRFHAKYGDHVHSHLDYGCDGHYMEDKKKAEEFIFSFRLSSKPLDEVSSLSPCTYPKLESAMRDVLKKCSTVVSRSGSLFCSNQPISYMAKGNTEFVLQERENKEVDDTLKVVSKNLGDVLYPILAGDDMIICGNEERVQLVKSLMEKLQLLSPRSYRNPIDCDVEVDPMKIGKGLGALQCNKSETGKLVRWRNVLDLNRCILRAIPYDGNFLAALNKRRKFPSDQALIMFIVAFLTNISSYVYLARHTGCVKPNVENLTTDDERILVNMLVSLDFEKFHFLAAVSQANANNKTSRVVNL